MNKLYDLAHAAHLIYVDDIEVGLREDDAGLLRLSNNAVEAWFWFPIDLEVELDDMGGTAVIPARQEGYGMDGHDPTEVRIVFGMTRPMTAADLLP